MSLTRLLQQIGLRCRGQFKPQSVPCVRRRLAVQAEGLEERLAMSAVTMTANEQLLLELINRARANPTAEMSQYAGVDLNQGLSPGTISTAPKQPLAPHQALVTAAGLHSQDILNYDYFSHTGRNGSTPSQRAAAAGYPASAGENIAWWGTTGTVPQVAEVYNRHISLLRSPGHRTNIMSDAYRESGTGIRYGVYTVSSTNYNSIIATEMFGNRGGNALITGVAYSDAVVDDNFYTVGEGVGNVSINATNTLTGAVFTVTTGSSGGYSLQVPNGTYTVVGSGGGITGQVIRSSIVVNSRNVKVDIVTTEGVINNDPPIDDPPTDNNTPTNGMGIIGRDAAGTWWQAASTGIGIVNQSWGTWSPNVNWQNVMTGDIDADGDQDLLGRANGEWWIGRSDGESFQSEPWAVWSTAVQWRDVMVGDFNGDGRDDVVGRIPSGVWWIGRSTGTTFISESWGNWSPRINWQSVQVGDFNGDNRDDLIGRANDGSWWVARSTGSSFVSERWGIWSAAATWSHIHVGDFNGDGRDELIGRAGRVWWVAESTGSSFVNRAWTAWSDAVTWSDVRIGDVDGDGRDDLVGRTGTTWWVARTEGVDIVNERWATWSASQWNSVYLFDIDRDGSDDLVARNGSDWWVGRSNGSQFGGSIWARWPASANWQNTHAGYFG